MKLKGKKGRSLPRETEAEETKKGKRRIEEALACGPLPTAWAKL